MKTFAAAIALICAVHLSAAKAQPANPSPAAIATAKEILTLKQATGIYTGAVANVIQNMKNTLLQSNLNYQRDLNEVATQIAGEMKPREAQIANDVARIYAQNFTEAELRDLLTFYKSPLGQKSLTMDPKAVNDTMSYMDQWAVRFSEEVNGRFRAEMRKRGKEI
ncbi:DUF2059 domain-containing protein [uncultured Sphingorhabdus sp.]|uniref:DUF2059 domain-containing protein n=1 Tax=uncultured Sphingorhabdus sp. TaxID=1686106 RepID=UPI00261DE87C|nr:DUF2059 domain-containing protein [uncultured Sphingorhabdus sp.]